MFIHQFNANRSHTFGYYRLYLCHLNKKKIRRLIQATLYHIKLSHQTHYFCVYTYMYSMKYCLQILHVQYEVLPLNFIIDLKTSVHSNSFWTKLKITGLNVLNVSKTLYCRILVSFPKYSTHYICNPFCFDVLKHH